MKSFRNVMTFLLAAGFLGLIAGMAGCGNGDSGMMGGKEATLRLAIGGFDRILPEKSDPGLVPVLLRITVSGPDIDPQVHEFALPDGPVSHGDYTVMVPVGALRWIEAEILNGAGEALYGGRAELSVDSGGEHSVSITLAPVKGPTGLVATAGPEQISLSWTPVRGVVTYNVYESDEAGLVPGPENLLERVESNTFVHGDLAPESVHYYIVAAVNAAGESDPSREVYATALPPVPAMASGASIVPGDGQLVVSWDAVPWAASYTLYWSEEPGGTGAQPRSSREGSPFPSGGMVSGITETRYTITGLTNGTTYYVAVTAVNGTGEGPPYLLRPATPTLAIPGTPTGLNASSGASGQVMLSWDAVPGAASYIVYWSTEPGVRPQTGTPVLAGDATSYNHNGLSGGVTYYYVVVSVNGKGVQSPPSGEIFITLGVPPPQPPLNLLAEPRDGAVFLSWSRVPGAGSYRVYWSLQPGIVPGIGSTLGPTVHTSTTHSGLSNGTTYYYVVTAVNDGGESGPSNEALARPTALVQLVPDLSIPSHGLTPLGQSSWDLSFDLFNGGTGPAAAVGSQAIEVAVCKDTSGQFTSCLCDLVPAPIPAGTTVARSTFYEYMGIDIIVQNNWYVAADPRGLIAELDEANNTACMGSFCLSPPSVAGVCPPVIPAPPSNVAAYAGDTNADISWWPSPGAVWYTLYWSTSPGLTVATGTAISPGPATYYLHAPLTNGTTYYYIVTASNAAGESPPSPVVSATPSAFNVTPFNAAMLPVTVGQSEISWSIFNLGSASVSGVQTAVCGRDGLGATACACDVAPGPIAQFSMDPRVLLVDVDAPPDWLVAIDPNNLIAESNETDNTACAGAYCTAPPAVTNVCVPPPAPLGMTTGAGVTLGDLQLSWNPVPGATGYNVYWSLTPGVTTASARISVGPVASYMFNGAGNTLHYFRLSAVNVLGEGPLSGEFSGTTNP